MLPTFEQRTDFPPAGDAALAGVLAQRCLQEEDRNATGEQEDQVGDEERAYGVEENRAADAEARSCLFTDKGHFKLSQC